MYMCIHKDIGSLIKWKHRIFAEPLSLENRLHCALAPVDGSNELETSLKAVAPLKGKIYQQILPINVD